MFYFPGPVFLNIIILFASKRTSKYRRFVEQQPFTSDYRCNAHAVRGLSPSR